MVKHAYWDSTATYISKNITAHHTSVLASGAAMFFKI